MSKTGRMRLLYADSPVSVSPGDEVGPAALRELYAWPDGGGLRSNFVATMDGAATGANGLTGSINNAADKIVFDLNRDLCDVVVVGAATADAEGYGPLEDRPLVVVSNAGMVPRGLTDAAPGGQTILVTREAAGAATIARARDHLGASNVWVIGTDEVDLAQVLVALGKAGHRKILTEGGPRAHAALFARNLIDEMALTLVPRVIGGPHPRISNGPDFDVNVRVKVLLESESTLLGLWRVPETTGHS